jgi:hypothetical protein
LEYGGPPPVTRNLFNVLAPHRQYDSRDLDAWIEAGKVRSTSEGETKAARGNLG